MSNAGCVFFFMGKKEKELKRSKHNLPFSAVKKTNKTPAKYSASSEGTTSAETSPEEERKRKNPRKLLVGLGPSTSTSNPSAGLETVSSGEEDLLSPMAAALNPYSVTAPVFQPNSLTKEEYLNLSADEKGWVAYQKASTTEGFLMLLIQQQATRIDALEKKVTELTELSTSSFQPPTKDPVETLIQAQAESAERETKKANFVVYGFSHKDRESDKQFISAVVEKAIENDEKYTKKPEEYIEDVFRMGKGQNQDGTPSRFPRLMKVKLKDSDLKWKIVRTQKKILPHFPEMCANPGYSQYFREDLTFMQRQHHATLAKERDRRNASLTENEPKYKIYNGTIVREVQGGGNPPRG